jgi:hypothetical protein
LFFLIHLSIFINYLILNKMKKITFSLLAAGLISTSAFSQVTSIITAPNTIAGSHTGRVPNGNAAHTTFRSMYNIPTAELAGLGANVVSFGFDFDSPTAVAAGGNITIWLQNSTANTYTQGTAWSTAGFTQVYSGAYTVPLTFNASYDIPITSFPYSGGAINVIIDYVGSTFDPQYGAAHWVQQDAVNAWGAYGASNTLVAPTTLALTGLIPTYRFGYANPNNNDVQVIRVMAPGKLNKGPQVVQAEIRNVSNTGLNAISVGLGVTGVNTTAQLALVPTLAAGATATVSFPSFNSPIQGVQTLSVGVANDQNNANNTATWSQSVTCDVASYEANLPVASYANGIGFAGSNTGFFIQRLTPQATGTIKGMRAVIGNDNDNLTAPVYGALMTAAGAIVATTNTITIAAAHLGAYLKLDFATPQNVTLGTDFYLGLAQTTASTVPIGMAAAPNSTVVIDRMYGVGNLAGGTLTQYSNYYDGIGYFGIEAIMTTTAPVIGVTSTKSVICAGESAVLTATGGATYAWVNPAVNTSTASISPSTNTTYTVTGTDADGCSNKATYTQTVSVCTGLMVNLVNGSEIKVFPNPAVNGKSVISGLNGVNRIDVYNILGQSVMTQVTDTESLSIDLTSQPVGTYLVKITDENNNSKTVKIVSQN